MNTGHRVLFAVWTAIVGWRLREFWQWKADSEVFILWWHWEMALTVEVWCPIADDTIFDNKSHYYYLKHNYHIFALHCISNNITYENMRSHCYHCDHQYHCGDTLKRSRPVGSNGPDWSVFSTEQYGPTKYFITTIVDAEWPVWAVLKRSNTDSQQNVRPSADQFSLFPPAMKLAAIFKQDYTFTSSERWKYHTKLTANQWLN
jgi:hypothetical protein